MSRLTIILSKCMCKSLGSYGMPTVNLLANCVQIWEVITISEARKSFPYDRIKLSLTLSLHVLVQHHGKYEDG